MEAPGDDPDGIDRALLTLPVTHAVALRLRRAGADQALIAAALGVDAAGVASVLAVAEEKLRSASGSGPV